MLPEIPIELVAATVINVAAISAWAGRLSARMTRIENLLNNGDGLIHAVKTHGEQIAAMDARCAAQHGVKTIIEIGK